MISVVIFPGLILILTTSVADSQLVLFQRSTSLKNTGFICNLDILYTLFLLFLDNYVKGTEMCHFHYSSIPYAQTILGPRPREAKFYESIDTQMYVRTIFFLAPFPIP